MRLPEATHRGRGTQHLELYKEVVALGYAGYVRGTVAVARRYIEEATRPPFMRIVVGMEAQSVDGQNLGKIAQI